MTTSAEFDTSSLEHGLATLTTQLPAVAEGAARSVAERTARELSGRVPVRTGRLRATVTAVKVPGGYGVTYGAGVPYARYIDHKRDVTGPALDGKPEEFTATAHAAAARVVNSL